LSSNNKLTILQRQVLKERLEETSVGSALTVGQDWVGVRSLIWCSGKWNQYVDLPDWGCGFPVCSTPQPSSLPAPPVLWKDQHSTAERPTLALRASEAGWACCPAWGAGVIYRVLGISARCSVVTYRFALHER